MSIFKINDSHSNKFIQISLIVFAIISTYLIYTPALNSPLFLDDLMYLEENGPLDIDSFSDSEIEKAVSMYPSRPVSILSFGLNFIYDFGSPHNLKATNLIIHIVTGISIYIFLIYLIRYKSLSTKNKSEKDNELFNYIPLIVSCLWLVHPFNVSTVAYAIQRMTMLSTLFTVISMTLYLVAIIKIKQHDNKIAPTFLIIASLISAALAFYSKEIGILTFLYLLLIEIYFNDYKISLKLTNTHINLAIYTVFTVVVLSIVAYGFFDKYSYEHRNYDLYMRLLTQSRVVTGYIQNILVPDISSMGIFLDDIIMTNSLLHPISNLYSMMVLISLLSLSYVFSNNYSLASFGILFYFTSHLIESTVLPLEIAFEHRNYLGSIGLMLSATTILLSINSTRIKQLSMIFFSLYMFFLLTQSSARTTAWGSEGMFYTTQVLNHPNSFRANYYIGVQLGKARETRLANIYYSKSNTLNSQQIASDAMVLIQGTDVSNNQAVLDSISNKLNNLVITYPDVRKLNQLSQCSIENLCSVSPKALIETLSSNNKKYISHEVMYLYRMLATSIKVRSLNDCKKGLIESKNLKEQSKSTHTLLEHKLNLKHCENITQR